MRSVRYLVVLLFASMATYYCQPAVKSMSLWLDAVAIQNRPSPSWGIAASIVSTLTGFVYVVLTQNRKSSSLIRQYRWAEQALIAMGKMKSGEILEYHRSYNWSSYAGLGFSTLFIIISLFFTGDFKELNADDRIAIFIGLALIGLSTVVLGLTDFFHTNTLTPLVTSDRRFHLMDIILKLGGAALMLQICAVGVFMSIINSWLSVLTSGAGLWLMIFVTERRGIPLDSIRTERMLTEEQAREILK